MSLHSPELKLITEDCLHQWKSGNAAFKLPDPVPMPRFLFELCWAMVRGELPVQKCKVALDSVVFVDEKDKEDVGSVLADLIAHMGQDLTLPGECRARLVKVAKWLVESSLVPSRFLQERCEEEFLWETELSKNKPQDLKGKEVRVNTRLLYQQTKFNLLREESEGYAKLITLLCQGGLESTTQIVSSVAISKIKSLIGHFDLDPNRVFDIVLECFELYPDNHSFYSIIPLFPKSHAAQILGFKFQYYQRMEVSSPVPPGLFRLTALLVKADFIDIDSIYVHLLPKDDEAFEHHNTYIVKRLDEVNKIGKINLAATGKDLMEDEKQDVTIDLFTSLDMEIEAVKERAPEIEKNQKLGLLIGFLAVDDWSHAHILLARLSHLNPVEHIEICQGLFKMIDKTISTAYSVICQTSFRIAGTLTISGSDGVDSTIASAAEKSSLDLPRELFQMLSAAGPYLYRDPILLQKVCIVLRAYYVTAQDSSYISSAISSNSNDSKSQDNRLRAKEARLRLEEALGACLLPSLQLIPANPAVGQEIWEVLSLLPYEVRYRLYGEWEKDDESIPLVLAARQIAKLDTRRILKRLAKDNLKQLGRMVAKLAHANPMTVLRTIVQQIEAYRDMITPVVDAFKYLTQLEYDILEYVVIERLAQGGREKLKEDGLNLSDWLQSLASFWGHLCKKYPSMELRGLFQYLVNQLKRGSGIELVLLQELIQQMANVQYTENMTEEQLDAMAGSETLRYQATLCGVTRNNKALNKSTSRLRDSLLPKEEHNLAIPLLLLIAQHRSMIIKDADVPYIKMVSEQFDRCHGTLLQYIEFLCSAISPASSYAQLIPPLNELIHTYHLDPEVAFLVYRPVMRLFRKNGGTEVSWPLDITDQPSDQSTETDTLSSLTSCDISLDIGSSVKSLSWSDLLDTVHSMLPAKAWNSLSPELYSTFWGLTLYDLYVPKARYEAEISKQHAAIKALEELTDNSNVAITKRKKEKERIQDQLDRLSSEFQKHEQHVASVRQRLIREKDRWLTSCLDTLKINMEFLQRCIFPRCIFSMPDAVYCASFVHTLHLLGTPFFNTVNHIDVLICKTLQPMICCCTEYEAGRLGRFLYETLKMAYHWKSDESVYERECGNMPGFAVYYRDPNSQRVTYGQFIKVHWKWSGRISRLLGQCLESNEYMEVRNALIVLTKISSVFPVIRKSGINLEKRVAKIKTDEKEDLKVLATGVAAALAARKSSWVSEEEFGMGYIDLKPAVSAAKSLASSQVCTVVNPVKDQNTRAKTTSEHVDGGTNLKTDQAQQRAKTGSSGNGLDNQGGLSYVTAATNKIPGKNADDSIKLSSEETGSKSKVAAESEARTQQKRTMQNSVGKSTKQDVIKEESKSGKTINRNTGQQTSGSSDKDIPSYPLENRLGGAAVAGSNSTNGNIPGKVPVSAARITTDGHGGLAKMSSGANDNLEVSDTFSKQQKRSSPVDDQDKSSKRKKGESEGKDIDGIDARLPDKERNYDPRSMDKPHLVDHDRIPNDEQSLNKSKDKSNERFDKDYRDKFDRVDRSRSEDLERSRDRSLERHGRERSIDRLQERGADKSKDERNKLRHSETSDKAYSDERFHGQNLPPPPPLPPTFVPQSVGSGRRDEDADRRVGNSRHVQRLSPRHDEKERRRSEENSLASQDDTKRRREDDFRDRKREERDGSSNKLDERDREKGSGALKDEMDPNAGTKRRKVKKEHTLSSEADGDYSAAVPPPPPPLALGPSQSFDSRERADRKGTISQHRPAYVDEVSRMHNKEVAAKVTRREGEQTHDREWEEEKRQRNEAKRKHRK